MKYHKYHALGNDYIALQKSDLTVPLTKENIILICHRNFGAGSDGILLLEDKSDAGFIVRVYNPDGSEAENSGNGMRILSRFLFDLKLVGHDPFTMLAKGERKIVAKVINPENSIRVDMGQVTFDSKKIPVTGNEREVLNEKISLLGEEITFSCANVGNPHCVVFNRLNIKQDALRFGPLLEIHQNFPNKINVQFAEVIDRSNIRLEIWERGAGYTLASGSSASAVASVAHRLGHVDSSVTMHMPGGKLAVEIDQDYNIRQSGPVTKVSEGFLSHEIFKYIPSL